MPQANLPRSRTLPGLTLAWLRSALEEGRWERYLPSERRLALEAQVSRAVLRTALRELEREGWILRRPRSRTEIARLPKGRPPAPPRRIVFLSPRALSSRTNWVWLQSRLLDFALEHGVRLVEVHDRRLETGLEAETILREIAAEYPDGLFVLIAMPEVVQRTAARLKLPALVLGHRFPDVGLCAVDLDTNAVCWHAATQLIRAGCRHVSLCLVSDRRAGDHASRLGFERALAAAPGVEGEVLVDPGPTKAVARLGLLQARKVRPHGMIVVRPGVAVALVCEALALGTLKDLHLISIYDDPIFTMLPVKIPRYSRANLFGKLAEWMARMLAGEELKPREYLVIPEYRDPATPGPGSR